MKQSADLKKDGVIKKGQKALLAVIFVFAQVLPSFAGGPGTSTANFLKMGVGGRGVAMGDAQIASANEAMALYWNPALLGGLNQNEVGFMHNNYLLGINHDVLHYIQPTRQFGTFGIGFSLLRVGDIQGYDASSTPTQQLSASDSLYTVGWGKSWDRLERFAGLETGVNFKFLQKKLGNDSASGMMGDFGLAYRIQSGWFHQLKTAFVLQNFGPGLKFIEQSSPLPRMMKLGLAYPLFGDNMTVAGDIVKPSDNGLYTNLGFEYRLWNIVAFRLGLKGQNDLDTGLTYGVGFGNERIRLDYAFVPFGKLGDSHRVSLGFRFGQSYRRAQVQTQIKQAYEKAEARYAQGYLVDAYIQSSQIIDVAPWHRPSRLLMRKIQQEFKDLEDIARREQLQVQIDDHFSRGEQYFQLDELLSAKREFEAILALQPNHMGARTYLKRIDDRFASLVQTFYEAGMRAFASGDYAQAKEQFQKVLVVDPNHSEAREQLTRTERLLTQAEAEAKDRAKMEAVRPVYMAALSAFERKDYVEALNKFEEILRIDSDNNEAKRYRGLCRDILAKNAFDEGNKAAQAGNWQAANENYKMALKYKPDYDEAQNALSKVRGQMGEQKKTESQDLYKEGLEAFLAGDQSKALKLWQKAVDLDPENLEAKRGLERLSQRGN